VFIFGFKYSKEKKKKGWLLNFILGQAKMAVYISRKYEIAGSSKNVELLFKGLMKARIKHDFICYSHLKKLENFEDVWSVDKAPWYNSATHAIKRETPHCCFKQ